MGTRHGSLLSGWTPQKVILPFLWKIISIRAEQPQMWVSLAYQAKQRAGREREKGGALKISPWF